MTSENSVTLTSAAITDNSGGTGSNTIAAITSTYDEAVLSNAVASLVDVCNELTIDVAALKTALTSSHSRHVA